ncbi:23886_t:CDS:1, partial [Racocetra persica]
MEDIHKKFRYYSVQLDKELSKYPQIRKLEEHTNVSKTNIFFGVVALVFVMIFFNFFGELLSDMIGWLYP